MLTYNFVEDYLELLAGYDHKIIIKLARYDVQIVQSMANATFNGLALTDRQAELAVKLILKYRRQFAKQEIDVAPVEEPEYRWTPRKVNRRKTVGIESDKIVIKFPYDREMIDQIMYQRTSSKGEMKFNKTNKTWYIAMTEPNVEWAVNYGYRYEFTIADELVKLKDRIVDFRTQPYVIELTKINDEYTIKNAPESMIDHVKENIGLSKDNILRLIDSAGTYGYTVDDLLFETELGKLGYMMRVALELIGSKHHVHVSPMDNSLSWLLDYAELVDRYPVCIYDPDTKLKEEITKLNDDDIVKFDKQGKTKTCDYNPYDVKIVYAEKIPDTWNFPVPLLITTREMMFGGKKVDWTKRAEKIIYYCDTKLRDY